MTDENTVTVLMEVGVVFNNTDDNVKNNSFQSRVETLKFCSSPEALWCLDMLATLRQGRNHDRSCPFLALTQVVRGVEHLHTQGLIHNNVSPASVWVSPEWDFECFAPLCLVSYVCFVGAHKLSRTGTRASLDCVMMQVAPSGFVSLNHGARPS